MADLDPILVARFWSKVEVGRPVECWPWRASRDKDGYGQFKGMASANPQRAHRVAYALVCGAPGEALRHLCHNRACCNPAHLATGTQKENHEDREAAGRCPREAGRFAALRAGAAGED